MRKPILVVSLSAFLIAVPPIGAEPQPDGNRITAGGRGKSWAGTYEVRLPDGGIRVSTLRPDGSFADTQDGREVDTGFWSLSTDGRVCFDHRGPDGSVARSRCYAASSPGDDGTFTVTPEAGPTLTLRKID